jgi:photosystem II stability/assembly factor-like uncharacterized protein
VLSADGSQLAAITSNLVFISTDIGATWASNVVSNNAGSSLMDSIASSANGNTLVVGFISGPIDISTNSGTTWTACWWGTNSLGISHSPPPGYRSWTSLGSSADGTKLFATDGVLTGGRLCASTNSGSTWTDININDITEAPSVAISANGNTLAFVAYYLEGNGTVFTSTNFGMTWASFNTPSSFARDVAVSADGTRLAAVFNDGGIYTSTNSGSTWTSNKVAGVSWYSVASSADGNILIAAEQHGGIWTCRTTPSPQLSVAPSSVSLTLAWTVPSTNFVMQQSSDLQNWADITNQPVLNLTNLQDEVILPPPGSNVFYRLKTP